MKAYFPASKKALDNLTEMYDLMWAMTAALWNMRCNVKGFLVEAPDASESLLNQRFASGCEGIKLNFKASIIEQTWEQNKEGIAWYMLGSLCSIFESWIANMKNEHFSAMCDKKMQFPNSAKKEIQKLLVKHPKWIEKTIYTSYASHKKIDFSKLDNMLYCYRVFKEMRNCYMHNGCIPTNEACQAYNEYTKYVQANGDLNVKELPKMNPIIQGVKIKPILRGVVGLSQILISIILTVDAELIKTNEAVSLFNDTVSNSNLFRKMTLSPDTSKACRQIKKVLRNCGLKEVVQNEELVLRHVKSLPKNTRPSSTSAIK